MSKFHKDTAGMVGQMTSKEPDLYCYLCVAGAKRVTPGSQVPLLFFELAVAFVQSFQDGWKNEGQVALGCCW